MIRLARSTALVILTLAGMALVWLFREPVMLFLVAIFLAASLRPLIGRLEQRNLSPTVSLAVVYALLGLGILAVLLIFLGPLNQDVQDLLSQAALGYERVSATWPMSDNQFQRTVAGQLPAPELLYKALSGQTDIPVVQWLLKTVGDVGSLLSKGLIVFILSLYWSIDQARFERLWLTSLPLGPRVRVRRLWRDLEAGIGAWIRSAATQVVITGVILWIGYALLGVPFAVLLAVIGSIAQLVPWLGILLSVTPVLLVTWPSSPAMAGLGAAYALTVALLFQLRVQPRYFPRTQTSSLLLLSVAIVLALAFGLAGLIVAPAATIAIGVLWNHLVEPQRSVGQARPEPQSRSLAAGLSQLHEVLNQSDQKPTAEVTSLVTRLEKVIASTRDLADNGRQAADTPVKRET